MVSTLMSHSKYQRPSKRSRPNLNIRAACRYSTHVYTGCRSTLSLVISTNSTCLPRRPTSITFYSLVRPLMHILCVPATRPRDNHVCSMAHCPIAVQFMGDRVVMFKRGKAKHTSHRNTQAVHAGHLRLVCARLLSQHESSATNIARRTREYRHTPVVHPSGWPWSAIGHLFITSMHVDLGVESVVSSSGAGYNLALVLAS